ncbi:MAG: DNA-directed RNA polymerase subunit beta' [Elusimicrobia bacterium]|nr:DNA-directed RNA polymerase subunit beta' [Elusimicrobiota bacterium]
MSQAAIEARRILGGGGGARKRKKVPALDFLDFDLVKLGIASPEHIRSWSCGEVRKPETINYRTLRPERDGLFCERIFGPVRDYECSCGKYRWIKFKGVVCDRCGVEVTESKVRRERMGHIELAVPVGHIWFLRKTPSRVGTVLNLRLSDLERVVYYARYVVLEDLTNSSGKVIFKAKDLLTEEEHQKAKAEFKSKLKVGIGAGVIRKLLEKVDCEKEGKVLREKIKTVQSEGERSRLIKRLRVLEGFVASGNRPEWMILTLLPVIPPDLRPLVPLEGGRFATSDLNDLYRRIINRNNRLKHIEALKAPEVMVYNEKRLLQEAVDALLENGARGKVVIGAGNRPLKSLSDILKGKQGRFRQNLLGKRVDYSGRSVIVVGPGLKLNQCGLPKEMALELFKPFIIRELMKKENVTLKAAKRMLEKTRLEVWDILEQITKKHPILLNRAPTLHRLGIQAFEPVLIEGKAIQLHPLTCAAFNADFDGDQMAVHVPLSPEAQLEARVLMYAPNNILSPASGRPITVPSQDMVLGICYLTKAKSGVKGEGMLFSTPGEVVMAYQNGRVDLHAKIKLSGVNTLLESELSERERGNPALWKDYTTVGRVLFNQSVPEKLRFINQPVAKKELSQLVERCYKELGHYDTVVLLDDMKKLGYRYATLSGLSISISDLKVPAIKKELIQKAQQQVKEIERQAQIGAITESERYNKVIDIWTHVTDQIADIMFDEMKKEERVPFKPARPRFNSVFLMADSGARGSRQQVRQLAGMRGLMAKPQKKLTGGLGEIIESPVIANFREGLTVLEYFISTHGGRKGLADTALKTADAGYLTRRLVDVCHDIVVTEEDCGTLNGVRVGMLSSGEDVIETLEERILGRVALEDVAAAVADEKGKLKEKVIAQAAQPISAELAREVQKASVETVRVRSVLTCESEPGICAKCYGMNLATGRMVEPGEAVGIIAAQSIGEPGTQLTLRTFHIGGTASRIIQRSQVVALNDGVAAFENVRSLENKEGQILCVSRHGLLKVLDPATKKERESYQIRYGARLKVIAGRKIAAGEIMAEWDPYSLPILTEHAGKIKLLDVMEGITLHEEKNKITGLIERTIIAHRAEKLHPQAVVLDKKGKKVASYPLPLDTGLLVENGQEVTVGDVLAKIPQEVTKTRDITGGLPRVSELFEARKPRNAAVISEIEGVVSLGTTARGALRVAVKNEETNVIREYTVPQGKHLVVYEGDRVGVGDPLTDGSINPHDILRVKGVKEVQEYLVNAVQEVYRLQGVVINDRHIEVVVRQMLENVKITKSGDTHFLAGEIVGRFRFERVNGQVRKNGGERAQAQPILLGITRASLASESFISAASFQETTRVLTEAAASGHSDGLQGLKENVIIGRVVPAGTGLAVRKFHAHH